MALGTVWAENTWDDDAWADDTWGESELLVVFERLTTITPTRSVSVDSVDRTVATATPIRTVVGEVE